MREIDEKVFAEFQRTYGPKLGRRIEAIRDFEKKLVCLTDDYHLWLDLAPQPDILANRINEGFFGCNIDRQPEVLRPILYDIALHDPVKAKAIISDLGDLQELIDTRGVIVATKTIYELRHAQPNDWDRVRTHIARLT